MAAGRGARSGQHCGIPRFPRARVSLPSDVWRTTSWSCTCRARQRMSGCWPLRTLRKVPIGPQAEGYRCAISARFSSRRTRRVSTCSTLILDVRWRRRASGHPSGSSGSWRRYGWVRRMSAGQRGVSVGQRGSNSGRFRLWRRAIVWYPPIPREEVVAHSGAVRIRGGKKGPIASTGGDVHESDI